MVTEISLCKPLILDLHGTEAHHVKKQRANELPNPHVPKVAFGNFPQRMTKSISGSGFKLMFVYIVSFKEEIPYTQRSRKQTFT